MRPTFLECTGCGKHHEVHLANVCECGAPLFARYDLPEIRPSELRARRDLWRYAPLLPVAEEEVRSRGEGGTPLLRLERIGSGGRVARLRVRALYVKDEGRNPTGTFKARGMAVAVPMARALGAESLVAPSAGNAGAALALYASAYGLPAAILAADDAPEGALREALAYGGKVARVRGDITQAGRLAAQIAGPARAFNVATLREPYRVEGKKTLLYEIWEDLGGMPEWILFPTGGGTGVAGIWKALQELRDLGWYEGPWPRLGLVQAEGCGPLVRAWRERRESADTWPDPRTRAAGLRVPATLGDRIVLRALQETNGAAVTVTEEAMSVAASNLAALEGVSACLEGAATLAGLRRLVDDGLIEPSDRVVLVNTGAAREGGSAPVVPTVGSAAEAIEALGLSSRAS